MSVPDFPVSGSIKERRDEPRSEMSEFHFIKIMESHATGKKVPQDSNFPAETDNSTLHVLWHRDLRGGKRENEMKQSHFFAANSRNLRASA